MLDKISRKIEQKERINDEETFFLYENAPLDWLQEKASLYCQSINQNNVYFNRNIHFEPTNKCIYSCKFCSFYRKVNSKEEDGAWDYSLDDLKKKLKKYDNIHITEIHITGGIYPNRGVEWACELLKAIRSVKPKIHIKAFTAVEIFWICYFSKKTIEEGLEQLISAGLNSLPGGGAEIFNPEIRKKITGPKVPEHSWLKIHKIAHQLNLKSNATMLYGHIENYKHRIDHMSKIRQLQDETQGFNCFIPLKYRQKNNELNCPEVSFEEDMRCYAISRLYFDNIPHLKAYWVMLGVENSFKCLEFGADDIDGTIDDTTKIYSMAGAEANPTLTVDFLRKEITNRNKIPVERDSLYNAI